MGGKTLQYVVRKRCIRIHGMFESVGPTPFTLIPSRQSLHANPCQLPRLRGRQNSFMHGLGGHPRSSNAASRSPDHPWERSRDGRGGRSGKGRGERQGERSRKGQGKAGGDGRWEGRGKAGGKAGSPSLAPVPVKREESEERQCEGGKAVSHRLTAVERKGGANEQKQRCTQATNSGQPRHRAPSAVGSPFSRKC